MGVLYSKTRGLQPGASTTGFAPANDLKIYFNFGGRFFVPFRKGGALFQGGNVLMEVLAKPAGSEFTDIDDYMRAVPIAVSRAASGGGVTPSRAAAAAPAAAAPAAAAPAAAAPAAAAPAAAAPAAVGSGGNWVDFLIDSAMGLFTSMAGMAAGPILDLVPSAFNRIHSVLPDGVIKSAASFFKPVIDWFFGFVSGFGPQTKGMAALALAVPFIITKIPFVQTLLNALPFKIGASIPVVATMGLWIRAFIEASKEGHGGGSYASAGGISGGGGGNSGAVITGVPISSSFEPALIRGGKEIMQRVTPQIDMGTSRADNTLFKQEAVEQARRIQNPHVGNGNAGSRDGNNVEAVTRLSEPVVNRT